MVLPLLSVLMCVACTRRLLAACTSLNASLRRSVGVTHATPLVCADARQHDASETNSSSPEMHNTGVEVAARRGLPQVEVDAAESRDVRDLGADLFRRLRDSDSDDDTQSNNARLGE